MPIHNTVDDADVVGFSPQAKDQAQIAISEFSKRLISEAQRIEAGRNPTSGDPEITQAMVKEAAVLVSHANVRPKRGFWTSAIRVLAAVLPLLAGILYDSERLIHPGYMAFYVLIIVATVGAVTASVVFE